MSAVGQRRLLPLSSGMPRARFDYDGLLHLHLQLPRDFSDLPWIRIRRRGCCSIVAYRDLELDGN